MLRWALLVGAIAAEVAGTVALRASQDHWLWLAMVAVGYSASFVLLGRVLRAGLAVGVAYGIWGALGTAATAVAGAALFGDPLGGAVVAGIGLVVAGVLLVQLGSARARRNTGGTAP